MKPAAARGARGNRIVKLAAMLRMSSIPCYTYQLARIDERLGGPVGAAAAETKGQ